MSTRYKNTVIAPSGNFGSLTVSGTQISLQDFTNWDTAYGWGDHAAQNYLTDYTVTVHDVTAHEGSIEITESQISDLGNYLTDYTVTVHDVTAHEGSIEITESQISDLQDYLLSNDIVSADNWSLAYTTVTANSASWEAGSSSIQDATDTDIGSPTKGEILVYTNGATQKWTNKPDRGGLEEMYNYANNNFYNEYTYSSTDNTVLTGANVYVTSAKSTHLFSRELIYSTTGTLTGIVTTDEQNNRSLTKNMYYNTTTGVLTSVTRSYN